MFGKILFLCVVSLNGIVAQPRTCPKCTDQFDATTCTQSQNCHDVCELHLQRRDRIKVEFTCGNAHTCTNHDEHGCQNNHQNTCSYCCDSLQSCLNELRVLVPGSTHPPAVTTKAPTTPALYTPQSNSTSDLANTTVNGIRTSTTENTVILTSTTSSPEPTVSQSCVQCGDFASDKPCSTVELLLNKPSVCPEGLPYCFETVVLSGGNLQVMRGCAENNFCRVEWDLGHSGLGCYPLDVTAASASCTYCCNTDACNTVTPPSDSSLVTFP